MVFVSGDRIKGEIHSDDGTIRLKGRFVDQKVELTGTILPDPLWLGDGPWSLRQFKIQGVIRNGVLVQTVLTGTDGALITPGTGEFETTVTVKSQLAFLNQTSSESETVAQQLVASANTGTWDGRWEGEADTHGSNSCSYKHKLSANIAGELLTLEIWTPSSIQTAPSRGTGTIQSAGLVELETNEGSRLGILTFVGRLEPPYFKGTVSGNCQGKWWLARVEDE